MTAEAAECRTFRLSRRLSVEITVGAGGMVCEWDPALPAQLTAKESRRYRHARDKMMQRLATMLGGKVLTVELGSGKGIVHEPKS